MYFRTETGNRVLALELQGKSTLSLNNADPDSSYSSIQHHYSIILSSILLVCFHWKSDFILPTGSPARAGAEAQGGDSFVCGLILQRLEPGESWRHCSSWLQLTRVEEVAGWGQSLANAVIWSFV